MAGGCLGRFTLLSDQNIAYGQADCEEDKDDRSGATSGLCRRDHLASRCGSVGGLAWIGSSLRNACRSSAISWAVRIAFVGLLGHRLEYDCLQIDGDRAVDAARSDWLFGRDPREQPLLIVTVKRRAECQQFVQRDAQRIDVPPLVHDLDPPRAFSGGIYRTVPNRSPVMETPASPSIRARPKSVIQSRDRAVQHQIGWLDIPVQHAA